MTTYYTTSELYHHGIKGQKWGVRRFQNPDGSLTAEGYQHWGLNPDGSKFKQRGKGYSEHTVKTSKKGAAIGLAAGIGLGLATGGASVGAQALLTGAGSLASIGMLGGMSVGTIVGGVQTKRTQKKIKKLLNEKGKVYVKDL